MQRYLCTIATFCLLGAAVNASRSIPASTSFQSYRPIGDLRVWTFVAKDSTLGQLFSTVKKESEIDRTDGVEIEEILRLDYNKIGSERKLNVTSNHYVSNDGYYLGDEMEVTVNGQGEELQLKREDGQLKGYFTRAGNKNKSELNFSEKGFAADINFLDLYECFLAMKDIKVGDTIMDSVIVPQTMLVEKVEAIVEYYGLISLYNKVKDSAFVIRFTLPQVMIFYFTPDKRLVKADYLAQQMKAYLDVVRKVPVEALTRPALTFQKFITSMPLYGIYLMFGAVALLFFAGPEIQKKSLYVFVIAGGASFILAAFTQVPLQTYLAEKIYLPKVREGQSPYFWAVIPALPAGIMQELIKLAVLVIIKKFVKNTKQGFLFIGAAVGAGFGIIEASFISSQLPSISVWSINLLERGFLVLFQAASGVLLAAVLSTGEINRKILLLGAVILANSWIRYLPVFVQKNLVDASLLYILLPVVPIILTVYSVYIIRQNNLATHK